MVPMTPMPYPNGGFDQRGLPRLLGGARFVYDSALEGDGFEPSVPRQESRRFEPASVPSRGGGCRRGGYGPGGDRRPDRAVKIADRRWCASEPPLESRIKPSRRWSFTGTDGSNPSPSSGESQQIFGSARDFREKASATRPPSWPPARIHLAIASILVAAAPRQAQRSSTVGEQGTAV